MQKLYPNWQNSFALTLIITLAGCASEPPVPVQSHAATILSGDQMLRDSQGLAHLGDRWKSGKAMTVQGNALIREGQAKIDEGNRMVDEGAKIMRESEESYKNIKH